MNWELISKATEYTAEEMGVALKRSAFSPNIKERMDHSCAILDSRGTMVAQAEHIPVHLGSFRIGALNILNWMCSNSMSLSPGDMLLTNDPYITGTHLNDVTVLAPVYNGSKTMCYVISKAHIVDVGGPVYGSINPSAKTLYEEGIIIDPVRILKGSRLDSEILSILTANFKDPQAAAGDLNAQIAANRTGVTRMNQLFQRYTPSEIYDAWERSVKRSRDLALHSMRKWRRGCFSALEHLELGSSLIPLKLKLEVSEEGIGADFTGTSSQLESPLNAVFGVTFSATMFSVRCAMASEIPVNEGLFSVVQVYADPASLLNPAKPAPVSGGNVETAQRVADLVFQALSKCVPGTIPSGSSGTMFNVMIGGLRENGSGWAYYETIGGGNGGRPGSDGVSAVHSNMTNTRNTPVEVAEREYPVLFTRCSVRRGSGGRGIHSGGDGIVRSFKVLTRARLSILADRFRTRPYALEGGKQGMPGKVKIVRRGAVKLYPSKFMEELEPGDEVTLITPGGSGYGKPPHKPRRN
ncbi:MAG: hydantoinase B/oxoprolinase family protein [Candidatus Marsarchaeota archaeon]|nr:hydantoinase B/oxoprolinase family protein [Candidatus Marsarchaeota archaeon]